MCDEILKNSWVASNGFVFCFFSREIILFMILESWISLLQRKKSKWSLNKIPLRKSWVELVKGGWCMTTKTSLQWNILKSDTRRYLESTLLFFQP